MSGAHERRRTGRLPGRFHVEVRERLATWSTVTDDVSARGCRLAPRRTLTPGALVQLAFDMGQGEPPLVVHAQVAWVGRTPPISAGLTFLCAPTQAGAPAPKRGEWIDRVLAARVRSLPEAPDPARAPRPTPLSTIILPPVG